MKQASWLVVVAAMACGPGKAPPAAEQEPAPPELRLPAGARPLRYDVELTLDPESDVFAGTIVTELELAAPTRVLWLNASEIAVESATFEVGGAPIAARPISQHKDLLGLAVGRPLAPGKAKLTIRYYGKAHKDDGDGIYRLQEGGAWYAFTQFEPTDARQAFPCFDEPSYKAPWRLTIRTNKDLTVVGNTPVESERDEPSGMKAVRFVETKPLPSYLVAFAVGPFELVDAGKTRGGAPIRIVVPRGHAKEVAYPVQATRPLVDLLEDYFGIPFPFEKLDLVAVPVFNAGAMENPGLITYRQALLLTKPGEETLNKQQAYAGISAHEIAHMLDAETGELPLSARACPDWVLPNEAGLGYYRMLPKGELLDRLLARAPKALALPERVGLVNDVVALVASGDVQNGVALALVDTLSKDRSRHIVEASIELIAGLDEMTPPELRPSYERLIAYLKKQ